MTAQEMWEKAGFSGEYDAWSFGSDSDGLAELVLKGKKRATSSAYQLYILEGEDIPHIGDMSVILDAEDNAVCIIKDVAVYVRSYKKITCEYAAVEGEGDGSLEYWRNVHEPFFREELSPLGIDFTEDMPVLCEEFELVYPL